MKNNFTGSPLSRAEKSILALILLTYFMIILDNSISFTAIPVIKSELGLSTTEIAWVQDAYTLAFGGTLLLGAQLGEVWGRTRVFIAGLVVFGLASFAVGAAASGAAMIVARAIRGLGAAIVAPTSLTLITAIFTDPDKRNRATGAYGTMAGLGSSGGMLIGGVVTTYASWRCGYWINVPITAAVNLLARRYLPALPTRPGRFDFAGAALITLGMLLVTLCFIEYRPLLAVIGLGVLGVAIWWERRAQAPIIPEHVWRHRVRGRALVARAMFAASLFGMYYMTTQYFELTLGLSALAAGLLFLVNCLPQGIAGIMAGRLVGRLGLRRVLLPALLAIAVGLGAIGWGMTAGNLVFVQIGMVFTGVGQGFGFGTLTTLGVWGAGAADAGAASGVVNTAHQMGATVGIAALVAVLNLAGDFAAPIYVAAGLMVGAFFFVACALLSDAFGPTPNHKKEASCPTTQRAPSMSS